MTKERTIEQQSSDCKIFGTKENCFGGATENECNHCDYKIQALEQQSYEDEVQKVVDYLLSPKSKSTSKNCVVEDLLKEVSEQKRWLSDVGYNVYNVDVAFESIVRAIQNVSPATPTIPKGTTNGDIIKAMFPNGDFHSKETEGDWWRINHHGKVCYEVDFQDLWFDADWWNALYKRGDSDGSN